MHPHDNPVIMVNVVNTGSVSKSCFYNDCVSQPEAGKTLADGHFSYQYYYSSFDQPKNYPAK